MFPTHRKATIAWLATVCFAAGVAAAIPLYTAFWWWDLLAHALAGVAIMTTAAVARLSSVWGLAITVALAVGWEAIEPHLSLLVPITFLTGDWVTDIIATIAGSLVVIGYRRVAPTVGCVWGSE